jgi:succinoglycan biosynthesis transport protein ExoP
MEIDIREYLEPLRKWWWLILLSTTIAGVSSYLATRQQVPVYRSTTTLMIGSGIENPNPSSTDLYLTQQLARTYVDIANRNSVRNATMEALGLTQLPGIFVRNINNTSFIEITVTDTNPERAQAVAEEVSRQLVLRSPTAQEEDRARQECVSEQLDAYETAIKETQAQIDAKQREIGELISAREIADMQVEIATLQSSLQTLQANYAALLPSSQRGATNTIREIEPASLPRNPVDQNSRTTIIIAAGIGFALAAAAAYVMEYLDDTIGAPALVTRLTGLPILAGIAKISSFTDRLITITKPRAPISEAFRVLRTAIQFSSVDEPDRIILVTSAIPEEGKSLTSANLAVVMAQAGNNVLLVDADLRRPSMHQFFDLPNRRGLTSLLLEFSRSSDEKEIHNSMIDTIQATRVGGLQILSCGPLPPNPSELLGSAKMRQLLDVLASQFDIVILDSPPVLSVTDAVVLGSLADSTIMVVRSGMSRKDNVKHASERLREVNINVIGCVINALSPKTRGYGAYYYYRDPYYSYGGEATPTGDEETTTGKLRRRFGFGVNK